MDSNEVDTLWEEWFANNGEEIEDWVTNSLKNSRETFEFQDGTHAKWVNKRELGLLLKIDIDEIIDLLAAWDDANAGSFEAVEHVMGKVTQIIRMLEASVGLDEGID